MNEQWRGADPAAGRESAPTAGPGRPGRGPPDYPARNGFTQLSGAFTADSWSERAILPSAAEWMWPERIGNLESALQVM